MTTVRFDMVYTQHFKCTRRDLREYPNLWAWTREIYQMEGVKKTINFEHIRTHYFTSHETINRFAIIPAMPQIDFMAPHDRTRFTANTPGLRKGQ